MRILRRVFRPAPVLLVAALLTAGLTVPPQRPEVALDDAVLTTTSAWTTAGVTAGTSSNGSPSRLPAASADGRYVAFASGGYDSDWIEDIFVKDTVTGVVTQVQSGSTNPNGNGGPMAINISADGRWVVFDSDASNLVSGDTNNKRDVFVADWQNGTVERISAWNGVQGGGEAPDISDDGRKIVFSSMSDLGLTNVGQYWKVYVYDRDTDADGIYDETGAVDLAHGHSATAYMSYASSAANIRISGDGNRVAYATTDTYTTNSTSLAPSDTGQWRVVVRDIATNARMIACLDGTSLPTHGCGDPDLNYDGSVVSWSGRLTGSSYADVFLTDTITGAQLLVSAKTTGGFSTTGQAWGARLASNPLAVSFASYATDLTSDSLVGYTQAFGWSPTAGTVLLSQSNSGSAAIGSLYQVAISPDGDAVAFAADAGNLISGDSNGQNDIYVRSRSGSVQPAATLGGAASAHRKPTSCECADPVDTWTGNFYINETDAAIPSIGVPFGFTRTYNAQSDQAGIFGRGWSHPFEAQLNTQWNGDKLFVDGDGRQLRFIQTGTSTYIAENGVLSMLEPVTGGFELTTVGEGLTYTFDTTGTLTGLYDRNDQGITLGYTSGVLTSATLSGSRTVTFGYTSGKLTSLTLPNSDTVTYGYDSAGRLETVTDLRGGTTTYRYDTAGLLDRKTDQNGDHPFTNVYDDFDRVVSQTDAVNEVTTFAYDPANGETITTLPNGGTWTDTYSGGKVISRRFQHTASGVDYTKSWEYDAAGNRIAEIDPNGNRWEHDYDTAGNLLETRAPTALGYEETWTYNTANQVLTHTNGRNVTTTFGYDTAGNLTTVTVDGDVTTAYDSAGLVTSVTDRRGKTTTFDHDTYGNVDEITTPTGDLTTSTYDAVGRKLTTVEARGNELGATPADYEWTTTYDAAGNVLTQEDPLGNLTTHTYDAVGRKVTTTDALSRTTTWAYDDAGRVTSVTAPGTVVTSFTYDDVGNMLTRTDAENHTTTYTYDGASRVTSITSPTGQVWSYTWDDAGNRLTATDPNGNATSTVGDGVTTYAYDEANRLDGIDYSDADTPDVTFGYDANSNRTSMIDGAGSQTYVFDDLDQVTTVTRGLNVFSYTYDDNGNVLTRTYPDSATTTYTYDDASRLATVTADSATTTYAYDAAGNRITTTHPNGTEETRVYDRAGRLVEVTTLEGLNVVATTERTYDAVGRTVAEDAGTELRAFTYDNLDRLTEACYQASCPNATDPFIRWTYDDVGNRTSEERPVGTTSYAYNAADQLLSTTDSGGTVTFDYDDNGNQVEADGDVLAYDQANRLVSHTASGATDSTEYSYDGDGVRLTQVFADGTTNEAATSFLWDTNMAVPQIAIENDDTNAVQLRRYSYGHDRIAMRTGTDSHFYAYDPLGSVAAVTDSNGALEWTHKFEAFGADRGTVQHMTAPGNPMLFAGEQLDDTGLYHLRARQYDPGQGRFTAVDPLLAMTGDPYGYANGNPLMFVDPLGLYGWSDFKEDAGGAARWVGDRAADAYEYCTAGGVKTATCIGIAASALSLGTGAMALGAANLAGGAAAVSTSANAVSLMASGYLTHEACKGGLDTSCAISAFGTFAGAASFGMGSGAEVLWKGTQRGAALAVAKDALIVDSAGLFSAVKQFMDGC